ncbi:hypothetical protein M3J09_005128 [Ascochyta lentis]
MWPRSRPRLGLRPTLVLKEHAHRARSRGVPTLTSEPARQGGALEALRRQGECLEAS